MSFLYILTFAVSLLALIVCLWLGLYLVSHNPKHIIAWLTALMLWCMTGVFLNVLLAISPPPVIPPSWSWLRLIFPFWEQETLTGATNSWLQGWSVAPALALWHHVTVLLLPGRVNSWRWVRILLGYFLAVVAVLVQTNSHILFIGESSDPLYLNSLRAGPWYPIFAIALFILTWTSVFNLIIAARSASTEIASNQLLVLAWAALIAGLAGLVSVAGSYFMMPIPILVICLLEGIPVGLIGWSVARYSALMEGRTVQRDFGYNLVLLGTVLLLYIPISLLLLKIYNAPAVILIVFPVLAVITHSSMTLLYRLMDRLFYKKETRQLRQRLRQLSRTIGGNETLATVLETSLEALCGSISASYGLILVFESDLAKKVASFRLDAQLTDLAKDKLTVDDILNLPPGRLSAPLADATLLAPLYGDEEQLGALVLGRPLNGLHYAHEDLEQIHDFSDRFSETILVAHRNSQTLTEIDRMVEAQNISASISTLPLSTKPLEMALRNLYDYASLSDNPLADLQMVHHRLHADQVTHLDRGKALQAILLDGLEKLRPGNMIPTDPPSREWYPYLILHEAYLNQTSNRDIMLKLYISEGTFNRTRRAAIRSLARALGEMEAITE